VPNVKPMWSNEQVRTLGMQQGTELRMPVLHVTF
jgi:hypothetical protein